jgi:hypothetical protein
MVDAPSFTPGLLTLDTTSNDTLFDIALDIPKQTLILQSIRVEMASQEISRTTRILYIDLPVLSGNQLLDGNSGQVKIPIMLDNAKVTYQTGLQMPIYMSRHLPSTFRMQVYNTNFALVSDLLSITLQFELAQGHIT